MSKVILYTTGCPNCEVLEKKLKKLNIEYETVTDTEIMIKKGFKSAPMLEVNGVVMDYKTALQCIKMEEK